jgi:8-oxo-dGTP pyrophosphatase MutT (NUDIX family)
MKKRTDEDMLWKTLRSDVIIERPWLTARRDMVQLPNGRVMDEYYVLHYPTWINVVAVTREGMMVLERQYRHACGIVSTEIVAGCVEDGETPLEGAKRELWEETGYVGGTWTELMTVSPNPSTMDNYCHCFLAEGVERTGGRHLDATEDIEVFLKTKRETFEMLQRGEFVQALMVAPLWKYLMTTDITP